MNGGVVPPPSVFGTPPLCPCPIVRDPSRDPHRDPGTVQPTGQHGAGHHAASGPINRVVLHIEYRSIAARRCALVGVPSGSWRKSLRRSAAFLNPPAASMSSRLPPVIAFFSQAIS